MTVLETLQPQPVTYLIKTENLSASPLAIIQATATHETLPTKIAESLPQIWTFLLTCGIQSAGHHIIFYPYSLENTALPFQVEIGVQIVGRFNTRPPIIFSSTPNGFVATTTHMGPYEDLPKAHQAIRNWCKDNKFPLAGPNWEVHGHWHDDPAQRRTDVFYLLM